jgi:hypothetical protein
VACERLADFLALFFFLFSDRELLVCAASLIPSSVAAIPLLRDAPATDQWLSLAWLNEPHAAFTHMLNFFAHKLSGLRTRGFAFFLVLFRAF